MHTTREKETLSFYTDNTSKEDHRMLWLKHCVYNILTSRNWIVQNDNSQNYREGFLLILG